MHILYNPNPMLKQTDDCVIRAVSKALGIPWKEAYIKLAVKGYEMADLPNNNAVWGSVLRDNGFIRETIPNTCPDCYTIEAFCKDHPKGIYVLGTGTHAITVIDGDFYDTNYSGDKIPLYMYRKE